MVGRDDAADDDDARDDDDAARADAVDAGVGMVAGAGVGVGVADSVEVGVGVGVEPSAVMGEVQLRWALASVNVGVRRFGLVARVSDPGRYLVTRTGP